MPLESGNPGCPPDLTAPIPPTSCPSEREAIAGKIPERDAMIFRSSAGPHRLTVGTRSATLCPLPECTGSDRTCPSRDAYLARWEAETIEAQHCVQEMIASIGGTSSKEPLLGGSFEATLTWSQIQVVASHPHVLRINAAETGEPPP